MLFSLNVNSVRDVLKRRGSRAVEMVDLPRYAQEQTGLHAMTMSTDLLAGATRDTLTKIRENGDRVGCACLLLNQTEALAFGDAKAKAGEEAVTRMVKVIEAASLLGCNSASLAITAKDDDEAMERVAVRMRRVLERADRLEIMVLIRPEKGLTENAERLTELVKTIGGFRIGTMPDFEAAVASGDPVHYLKRLTPYASVVNASTLGFKDPEPEPEPIKKKKKAAVRKKTAKATEPEEDEEGPMSVEDAVLAALEADLEDLDDLPVPEHLGYDLNPLVGAVRSVGFDGSLAIDYRGSGDGTLGVLHSRDALEAALEAAND
ncbi:MAG: sugar phosphate isomerase/epimerase [Phycisphaerales bacterium]|nr:TIM barrel protein [Planctomycetota bacterium]MCH8507251.1 sugar phosphate isomerase/epimerase [Phycisphaerales bacterium]